ncbi:NMCC_0638 family (lipo)protein [Methylibium sp.]|uniref:NMCC_0638 family (lipo)protein n=1 Tax=Methylibium sp. TaxID=2067992 RepID=UPI003D0B3C26
MTLRRTLCCAAVAACAGGAVPAGAQSEAPEFVAPAGSARTDAVPAERADPQQLAQEAVDLYSRTCAAPAADAAARVDLALAAGLAPLDGDAAQRSSLLGGAPGQAYAAPGRATLLQLAIADDGRCVVWVQQADGPRVRAGFLRVVDDVYGPGTSLRPTRERVVQVAGGWRQQTGFDLGDEPARRAFDAITLVGNRPGVQLLRTAAVEPTTAR